MNAFLIGIAIGFTITISFGPGFMALFQTSLVRGHIAGIVFATGMLLSDLLLVGVCYLGLSELILKGDNRIMGIIAGLILIIMGILSLLRKPQRSIVSIKVPGLYNSFGALFIKGFLINVANPFSLIFWVGIVGFGAKNWGLHNRNFFFLFAGVFLTAFSTDLLKCYLSGLLRKMVASKAIYRINRVMGLVFILIGLFLIYKVQI